MKESYKYLCILLILIVSISCEDEINTYKDCHLKTTFVDSTNIIPYTDKTIINFSLNGSKYPDGFYNEGLSNSSIPYVNTFSIGFSSSDWIYLCSNDSSEAFNWIRLLAHNSNFIYSDTEKYYQALAVDSVSQHRIYYRVHKCSYLDRSIYEGFRDNDSLGILNKRPINENSVKEVIEYLWYIKNHQINNPKVFYTTYYENSNNFIYDVYVVNYTEGDFDMCPYITVEKQSYSLDKNTGIIIKNIKVIRVISDGRT